MNKNLSVGKKMGKMLVIRKKLRTFAPPLEKAPLVDRGTDGKINCIEI
jgi:hypothetical protein